MRSKKKIFSLLLTLLISLGAYFYNNSNLFNSKIKSSNNENITKNVILDTNNNLNIYYFDVGQADSILIQNDGKNMLIDAGNKEDGDKITNYLKSKNISKLDVLVATHPHEDHIGGMSKIVDNFDIGMIYMPDVVTTSYTFEALIKSLENKKLSVTVPKIDANFTLGQMDFKVLYTGVDSKNLNNASIVLKMDFGKTSYLFTGDAPKETEDKILNKDIKADVLKVGHHGSNYSSSDEFLDKVKPKYAIISVGKNNIYHHPAESTINKLKERNIKIFRTDQDKTIELISDGTNIKINKLDVSLDG